MLDASGTKVLNLFVEGATAGSGVAPLPEPHLAEAETFVHVPPPTIPELEVPDFPGVIRGTAEGSFSLPISNFDYHNIPSHISHSGMRELLRSLSHYATYIQEKDSAESKVNFGSAAHSYVLEPEEFKKQYVVFDGRRQGKIFAEFKAANPGAQILNLDEMARIVGIGTSLKTFRDFPLPDAIRIGESEKSIFWVNEETGVPCRVRLDSLNPFAIFDLKTIDDARPEKVIKQIMQMDYDLQAYMYGDGVHAFTGKRLPFNFLFAEDKAPHGIWLYAAGSTLLASGREKFLRGAEAFKKFRAAGQLTFPQVYPGAFSVIEAPQWRRRELAQLEGAPQPRLQLLNTQVRHNGLSAFPTKSTT